MPYRTSNVENKSRDRRNRAVDEPTLAAKVAHLSRPGAYPERPHKVETVETHISWVFLTDHHAYKLKKPVRYDFLDFSTLAARKEDCEAELRLNQRLAPNIYLCIVAMTLDENGELSLDTEGHVVDWLVKMRRLPRDKMLDQAIKSGTVQQSDIHKVARALAQFYALAQPVEISAADYRARLVRDIGNNEEALLDPAYELFPSQIRETVSTLLSYLDQAQSLFDRRVLEGRIVEAHGDLRAEHICLNRHPVFIDCLEFNRDFRRLDPLDELSFLALDCERLGAAWIGDILFQVYQDITWDEPDRLLISFYSCHRALLRAKLAIWHLKDHDLRDRSKWTSQATAYLKLAERFAGDMKGCL